MSDDDITVRHADDRFEILVDGAVAGFTQYLADGGRRIFFHTQVDDAYQGRGLAARVVDAALTRTREDGLRVVPVCPYVKRYVERHAEHTDLADPVTDADLAAVRAHAGKPKQS